MCTIKIGYIFYMSHNEAGLNTAGLLKELSGVLFTQQKQRACLTLQKQQLMSIGSMDKAKKKTPTQHETIAMKSVVVDRKRSEEMQARRKSRYILICGFR